MESLKKPVVTKLISNPKVVTNVVKPTSGSANSKKTMEGNVKKLHPVAAKPKVSVVAGKGTEKINVEKITKPTSPVKPLVKPVIVKRIPDSTTTSVGVHTKAPASPVKVSTTSISTSPGRVTSMKSVISSSDVPKKTSTVAIKSQTSIANKTVVKPVPRTSESKAKLSSPIKSPISKSTILSSPSKKLVVPVGEVKSPQSATKNTLNVKSKPSLTAVKSPVTTVKQPIKLVSAVAKSVSLKSANLKPALKADVKLSAVKNSKSISLAKSSGRVTTVKSIKTQPSSAVSDAITRIQDECNVEIRDADSTTAEGKISEFLETGTTPSTLCSCELPETQFDEQRAYVVAEQLLTVMNHEALQEFATAETNSCSPEINANESCVIQINSEDMELNQQLNNLQVEPNVHIENEITVRMLEVNNNDFNLIDLQLSDLQLNNLSDENEAAETVEADKKQNNCVDVLETTNQENSEVNQQLFEKEEEVSAMNLEENIQKSVTNEESNNLLVEELNEATNCYVNLNTICDTPEISEKTTNIDVNEITTTADESEAGMDEMIADNVEELNDEILMSSRICEKIEIENAETQLELELATDTFEEHRIENDANFNETINNSSVTDEKTDIAVEEDYINRLDSENNTEDSAAIFENDSSNTLSTNQIITENYVSAFKAGSLHAVSINVSHEEILDDQVSDSTSLKVSEINEEVFEITQSNEIFEMKVFNEIQETVVSLNDEAVNISEFDNIIINKFENNVENLIEKSNETDITNNEEPNSDILNTGNIYENITNEVEESIELNCSKENEEAVSNIDTEELNIQYDDNKEVEAHNDGGCLSDPVSQLIKKENNGQGDTDELSSENAVNIYENHFNSQLDSEISDDQNSDGFVMLEAKEKLIVGDHETPDDVISLASSESYGEATSSSLALKRLDDDDQQSTVGRTIMVENELDNVQNYETISTVIEEDAILEYSENHLGDTVVSDTPSEKHYTDENVVLDHVDDEGFRRIRQKKNRKRNKKNERKVIAENKITEKSMNVMNDEYFDEHYNRKNSRRWRNPKKQNTIYGEPHWRYYPEN